MSVRVTVIIRVRYNTTLGLEDDDAVSPFEKVQAVCDQNSCLVFEGAEDAVGHHVLGHVRVWNKGLKAL